MPTEIKGASPAWRIGAIAQGLLDAGVLREDDWNGDLVTTINSGLTRWVNVDLGLALDLEYLPLRLLWVDDFFKNDTFFLNGIRHDGAFILDISEYSEPGLNTVGYWIDQFERTIPGIGGDILHALCWASDSVFNGMSPGWAYSRAGEYAESYDEEWQEEQMGGTHPKEFEHLLPEWVYTYSSPNVERLTAARDMAPGASIEDQVTDRLREASRLALEILRWQALCDDANQVWRFVEFPPVRGIAIRWQVAHDVDPTGWVMDEDMDEHRQTGEQSPLVVLIPFGGMENIPRTVEKLAATLRLGQAIDDLLKLIEDEKPIVPVRIPIQVAVTPQRIRV